MVPPQAALQTDRSQKQKRRGKFPRWILIVASILTLLFFIGGAVFWIWKVWGDLSNTLGAIFTALGTIFGFIALVIAIPPFFQYLEDRRASSPTPTTPAPDNNQGDSTWLPLKSTEPLIRLRGSASYKKAVVFIHGIGAKDPKKYWQQFTDVLLRDTDAFIKDFDVYVWGYPTHKGPKRLINLTRFLFTGRPTNAAPEIVHLGGLWRYTYQAQFSEYQDTILVCHSMGGLVVKSYIVDVLAEGQSSELETVRHVTFYATPHCGAPIAGVALNDQFKGMTITSEFVERIRRSWYDHVVRWKGSEIGPEDYSYNRYIPHLVLSGISDAVVPYNFAEISGMPCESVPGNHTTIIQPAGTNDTRYRIWRNELEKIFAPSTGNVDDQKTLYLAYEGEKILNPSPSPQDQPFPQSERSVNQPPNTPPPSPLLDRPPFDSSPVGDRNVLDDILHYKIVQVLEGIPTTASIEGRNTLLIGIPQNIIRRLSRDRNNDATDLANLLSQLDGLSPLMTGERPLIIFIQNAIKNAAGLRASEDLNEVLEELKRRYEGPFQKDAEPPVNPPGPLNKTDHTGKRDIARPSQNAPFLDWAHYYIKDAKEETKDAQSLLTASGYISPIKYTNKFDSLGKIKKSFEEFHQRIGNASRLSPEITLSREQLRVKVNRAIEQIEAIQSCIKDCSSPCNDIERKFSPLLQTLSELGRDCKLNDQ